VHSNLARFRQDMFQMSNIILTASANSIDESWVTPALAYMAPELLNTGQGGIEVDVYAFGILSYEVMARRDPYSDQVNTHTKTNTHTRTYAYAHTLTHSHTHTHTHTHIHTHAHTHTHTHICATEPGGAFRQNSVRSCRGNHRLCYAPADRTAHQFLSLGTMP